MMIINTLEKIRRARSELVLISLVYAGTALLTFCAAYCTLGVLVTGFGLAVNMGELLLVVLLASFTVNAIAMIFRGWGILALAVPLIIVSALNHETVAGEFKWFVYNITVRYSEWLPVPVFFPEYAADMSAHMLFFSVVGVVTSFLLAAAIGLKRSTVLTLLATMPLALLSFVLVDTQADVIYLMGLVSVYLTLLLSNTFYLDNLQKSALALIPTFVLAAALAGSIYLAAPPERYERSGRAETIRYYIYRAAEQAAQYIYGRQGIDAGGAGNGWYSSNLGMWSFNTTMANIADAGARVINNQRLLEIQVSQPGIFYLRGYSLDSFDGRAWLGRTEQSGNREFEKAALERPAMLAAAYAERVFEDSDAAALLVPDIVGMSVRRLEDITNVRYMPYYSGDGFIAVEARANTAGHSAGDILEPAGYDMGFYYVRGSVHAYAAADGAMLPGPAPDDYVYTQIDGAAAQRLRRLAVDAGIDAAAEREEVVDAVAAYVRSAAVYTLTPGAIPRDEDFAVYFLETLREGYCIHFATAATLMLRALDIPARFTSGYVAAVGQADTAGHVVLTDANAHAWVEVLYEDTGWLMLEVTPSSGGSVVPVMTRPHTPSEEERALAPTPVPTPQAQEQEQETPAPAPSGQGEGGAGAGSGTGAGGRGLAVPERPARYIALLVTISAVVAALVVRRRVLIEVRNKRFMQNDANAAVICMWQHAKQLCRGQAVPPSDVEELALKARFSQHRMTEEEREYVLAYVRRLASEVYGSKGEFGKLWLRYVRGLD